MLEKSKTNKQTNKQASKQANKQTNKQTNKEPKKQKQKNWMTERQVITTLETQLTKGNEPRSKANHIIASTPSELVLMTRAMFK